MRFKSLLVLALLILLMFYKPEIFVTILHFFQDMFRLIILGK